jgi:hypothetical protein
VEERYLAKRLRHLPRGVEEHLPVTVINDWNLNPSRPGEVQGADPAERRVPGRPAGRRRSKFVAQRRRAGGESRRRAVRRVRHAARAGKVVYLAAGFDAAHYAASYPYYRLVLAQAMRWAASAPPPVEVAAPMCVHAVTVRQKKDGERLIVHLYNDVNTTAGHGHPAEEVPLREETLPIHDIGVTFRGYAIKRVRLEPEGLDLKPEKGDDAVAVTVPKLAVHTMVVAELG